MNGVSVAVSESSVTKLATVIGRELFQGFDRGRAEDVEYRIVGCYGIFGQAVRWWWILIKERDKIEYRRMKRQGYVSCAQGTSAIQDRTDVHRALNVHANDHSDRDATEGGP